MELLPRSFVANKYKEPISTIGYPIHEYGWSENINNTERKQKMVVPKTKHGDHCAEFMALSIISVFPGNAFYQGVFYVWLYPPKPHYLDAAKPVKM
jgi:hypothetical protein